MLPLIRLIARMRAEGHHGAEGGLLGGVVRKDSAIKRVSPNACETLRRIRPPHNAILGQVLKACLLDGCLQPVFQLIHQRGAQSVNFLCVVHVGKIGGPKRIALDDPL